jgi:hypothetical protein
MMEQLVDTITNTELVDWAIGIGLFLCACGLSVFFVWFFDLRHENRLYPPEEEG